MFSEIGIQKIMGKVYKKFIDFEFVVILINEKPIMMMKRISE